MTRYMLPALVLAALCPSSPCQSPPELVVEIADLSRPLKAIEDTAIGKRIVERFGGELSGWLGLDPDLGKALDRIGRLRVEVGFDLAKATVRFDLRARTHEPVTDSVVAAVEERLAGLLGEHATSSGVQRDGDELALTIRSGSAVSELSPRARKPLPDGGIPEHTAFRATVDGWRLLQAVGVMPDIAAGEEDPDAGDESPDEMLTALEATQASLGPMFHFDVRLHRAGERVALDLRPAEGVWLSEAGRDLLRLMPRDLEGGFGVATTDFARYLEAAEAMHGILPLHDGDPGTSLAEHVEQETGIDLNATIAAFEGSYGGFVAFEGTNALDPGVLYAFALRDAAAVERSIEKLLVHAQLHRSVAERVHAGYQRHQLGLGPLLVHWAFVEDTLFIAAGASAGRDAIEAALENARAIAGGETVEPFAPDWVSERHPEAEGILVSAFELRGLLEANAAIEGEEVPEGLDRIFDLGFERMAAFAIDTDRGQVLRMLW